jgi:N-acetylmuramoyl-L-alanine amidase
LRTDFSQAADFFQRAVNRFPANHSWVDDCLYRKAEITAHRLDGAASATADLKTLLLEASEEARDEQEMGAAVDKLVERLGQKATGQ